MADDGVIEWTTLEPPPGVRYEPASAASIERDEAAFARLYTDQFASLVRLAALLVGSPAAAEDLVQEAFAKLHGRFRRVDEPRAWLRVAVVNASRNERRRLGRLQRHLAGQAGRGGAPGVVPPPEPEDSALLEALRRLPARQRAVVVLRFYLGLNEAEIATTLGTRPGTVKSRLHRALAQLRAELGPRAADPGGAVNGDEEVPPCGS